jgi:hypothetical protein
MRYEWGKLQVHYRKSCVPERVAEDDTNMLQDCSKEVSQRRCGPSRIWYVVLISTVFPDAAILLHGTPLQFLRPCRTIMEASRHAPCAFSSGIGSHSLSNNR